VTANNAQEYVLIGKIGSVFGVKGWLKVASYTSLNKDILSYKPWYFRQNNGWQKTEIASGKMHGKNVIVQLDGINDRDQAMLLTGTEIAVLRSQLPELAENEYYWSDLEGLSVESIDGQLLGKVSYLMETGANDVLVVETLKDEHKGDKEILIPYISGQVIKSVDLKSRKIVVDWDPDF